MNKDKKTVLDSGEIDSLISEETRRDIISYNNERELEEEMFQRSMEGYEKESYPKFGFGALNVAYVDLAAVLERTILDHEYESEVERYLLGIARNRSELVKEFKSKPDKVKLREIIEYVFCNTINGNLGKFVEEHFVYEPSLQNDTPNAEEFMARLFNGFRYSANQARKMIFEGAYVYESHTHLSRPLADNSESYRRIISWVPEDQYGSAKNIPDLFEGINENLYLSRSELNQLYLFTLPSSNSAKYQIEVRKKAYRAYLKNGFLDTEEIKQKQNHERELILLGWMLAKGLKKGDRIHGYSQKSLWRELESAYPEYFYSSIGEPLGDQSVKGFFKGCTGEGICRFS